MKIEISIQLINSDLTYLGTKPYQEVAPLIEAIQAEAMPKQDIAPDQHVVIPA